MTSLQLIFLFTGFVTLVAALLVVITPKLVHGALWLILALAGIAVLFVLLDAGFLAVAQVAIYIDAIAILIILVIMLTSRVMKNTDLQLNRSWWIAALTALLLFGGMLALLLQAPILTVQAQPLTVEPEALLEDLGSSLVDVNRYVLPFEVASILLLAALVGSIMIARPRTSRSEKDEP
jgi:NADH-quinone oxidoreductase subunit J